MTNNRGGWAVGAAMLALATAPAAGQAQEARGDWQVRRYFLRPSAHWFEASEALTTRHKLAPWVVGAGTSYRF